MKIIFSFCFSIVLLICSAQVDEDDFEEIDFRADNLIKGTAALPISNNQLQARRFGLVLNSIIETPCNSNNFEIGSTKINSIQLTDSTLTIDVKIVDNCCFSFICDFQVLEDSIINLISYGYGETHCACECCFGITYNLLIGPYGDDHEFDKIKGVMINNERKTFHRLKK